MKMMTKEIKNKLPKLYENDGKKPEDVRIIVKYFNPCGSETWYITEYDGEDTMYGYVTGSYVDELGYVSLKELTNIRVAMGLRIERDLWWDDTKTLADVMKRGA